MIRSVARKAGRPDNKNLIYCATQPYNQTNIPACIGAMCGWWLDFRVFLG